MSKDEYIKAHLRVGLEVDTSDFALGYLKGFTQGFRKGSTVEKHEDTETCFITKIVLEHNAISSFEFCEVIKNKDNECPES